MSDPDVLIAGAGPTGLVLALWLQRLGVRVRIVDKAADAGTTSRALVLHAVPSSCITSSESPTQLSSKVLNSPP